MHNTSLDMTIRYGAVVIAAIALSQTAFRCRDRNGPPLHRGPASRPVDSAPASQRATESRPTSAPTPATSRRPLRVVEYDPCKDDAVPRPEIETALDYLARRGSLPPQYRVRAFEWRTGWDVMVIAVPAMPGGHKTVRLSSDGRVVKLIPGA